MIKRVALYGTLTGVGLVWGAFWIVDKAVTTAVKTAWRPPA